MNKVNKKLFELIVDCGENNNYHIAKLKQYAEVGNYFLVASIAAELFLPKILEFIFSMKVLTAEQYQKIYAIVAFDKKYEVMKILEDSIKMTAKILYALEGSHEFYELDDFTYSLELELDMPISWRQGTQVIKTHADYFDVDDMLERMQEKAYQEMDDFVGDYCIIDEKTQQKIKAEILEVLANNMQQPRFFGVENVVEKTGVLIKNGNKYYLKEKNEK